MYKITLGDVNLCPVCDGTVSYFTENLEEFEKHWVPLMSVYDIDTVDRYYRSKHGQIVTDTFSDSPELNVVQQADGEIISKRNYRYKDKKVRLVNFFDIESEFLFNELHIHLAVIRYADDIMLCGQYEGKGCCRLEKIWNDWYKKDTEYCQMHFWGNKIAEYKKRNPSWEDIHSGGDAYKDFYTNDREFYKDEEIKTFVWIPIKYVDAEYKIKPLTVKEMQVLMADILGESG